MDSGNNKKALQEAEKLLKKQSNLDCAKVLKGLALLRLGQRKECFKLVSEVHSNRPVEGSVLRTLRACYTELQRDDLLCETYENAIKKVPADEELYLQLFTAYLRQGDFKRLQQVALTMNRLFPNGPYYYWAIMSVYLQAINASDSQLAQKMYLPLAQRLLEKSIADPSTVTEAQLELYLMILERQNSFEKMLQVLNDPIFGHLLSDNLGFVARRKAILLRKSGKLVESFCQYFSLLVRYPDQLEYYEALIDLALEARKQKTEKRNLFEEAVELFVELDSRHKAHMVVRGPQMAKMQLLSKVMEFNQDTKETIDVKQLIEKLGGNHVELLYQYFVGFGHKPACMFDLAHLTIQHKLSEEQRQILCQRMKDSLKETEQITSFDNLNKYVTWKAATFNSFIESRSKEECLKCLEELVYQYDQALILNENSLKTDFSQADSLVQLIFFVCEQHVFDDDQLMLHLICILQKSLRKSPSNYTLKLYLIQLYNLIGATERSFLEYRKLDIKYIQRDTLGYFMYSEVLHSGRLYETEELFDSATRFYQSNFKETFEQVVSCFHYGTFDKVEEFYQLREKLIHSVQNAKLASDRLLFELTTSVKSVDSLSNWLQTLNRNPFDERFEWDLLKDNRDFSVFRAFAEPVNDRVLRNQEITFNQMKLAAQAKDFFVRLLIASNSLLLHVEDGFSVDIESYSKLLFQFKQLTEKMNSYDRVRVRSIVGPGSVGFEPMVENDLGSLLVYAFSLPLELASVNQDPHLDRRDLDNNLVIKLQKWLQRLDKSIFDLRNLSSLSLLFEQVHSFIETLSLLIALFQLMWQQQQQNNQSNKVTPKSKDKKKKSSPSAISVFDHLNYFFDEIEGLIDEFILTIKKITTKRLLEFKNLTPKSTYLSEPEVSETL